MSTLYSSIIRLYVVAAIILMASGARGELGTLDSDSSSRLSTVPHDPAVEQAIKESDLGRMIVLHGGWRETLTTFSRIALYDITGRRSIKGQAPEYTILSMAYQPEYWADAAIIPIEHPDLLPLLGAEGKWVSPRFLADNPNINKVVAIVQEIQPVRQELETITTTLNAVEQARKLGTDQRVISMFASEGVTEEDILRLYNDEEAWLSMYDRREELLAELDSQKPLTKAANSLLTHLDNFSKISEKLLLVPDSEGAETVWVRPLTSGGTTKLVQEGQDFESALREGIRDSKPELIIKASNGFMELMNQTRSYTSERYRTIQNLYTVYNPWNLSAWVYLLSALIFSLYFFFNKRPMYWSGISVLAIGLLLHTAAVVLRGYLKGHIPVTNIYESLTFTSWSLMIIAVGFELWNRRGLVGVGSTALAFLFLMGASQMPLHETRIHPLRAVLNSYWLNIHVTMMLISYAAFAISAFFAGLYLLKALTRREALFGGNPVMAQGQTEEFAYRLVQFGWPILTFGIALGAVWADTAWGRFWGWDPKETWAFITWVGYTVYLHMRMVMGWRGVWSASACVIGFILVLITWLGVSYIPMFSGGLHSYASPTTF